MENIILIILIVAILGLAAFYIYKSKKSGQKCVGCPYGKDCASKNCCSRKKEK